MSAVIRKTEQSCATPNTRFNHHKEKTMKRFIALFSLLCAFGLASCSSDPYEKYVGLWEAQVKNMINGKTRTEVLEITKKGDSFVFSENILINTDTMLLTKKEGQLTIDTGLGSIPFAFGENKDVLLVGNNTYKRITPQRLEEIKAEIKREKDEEEARQTKCKQITEAAEQEYAEIRKRSGVEYEEMKNLLCAAHKQYRQKYAEAQCRYWIPSPLHSDCPE